ncbi:MAG: primosomal replication protein N [Burkholderiaceae bacterium]|nr:primosomal replication protein N [Burkholderiaceae bacterium]
MRNRVQLSGTLTEREALRYTPAGIAMLGARLSHRSETTEAGQARQLEFDVALRFAGAIAARADRLQLGASILVDGFLAPRRRQSKSLVVHVTEFAPASASSGEQN